MSGLIETTTSESSISQETSLIEQMQEQLKLQQEELFQQRELLHLHESTTTTTSTNAWGFTHGLIVGQFSVLFVIIVFVKFFVFAESSSSSKQSTRRDASGVIVKRDKKKSGKQNSEDGDVNDERLLSDKAKVKSILEKTYYDVDNHAPETLDWFNVLVAQTISQLRSEAILADNIYHSLNGFLENAKMPEFLGKINLTEIDIGDDFPIFSNCRIKHSTGGRLEAKIDVDLSDTLTLGIDTKLLLNHPRALTAVLPVELTVSIVRFSGCLTVSLINTNDPEFVDLASHNGGKGNGSTVNGNAQKSNSSKEGAGTALMFSFSPDYRLEFIVKSLIGSRAKLQDVPKISELIESQLRTWFIDRCVEPRFQVVRLPSLWPRSKNTREPVKTKVDDETGRKNL